MRRLEPTPEEVVLEAAVRVPIEVGAGVEIAAVGVGRVPALEAPGVASGPNEVLELLPPEAGLHIGAADALAEEMEGVQEGATVEGGDAVLVLRGER